MRHAPASKLDSGEVRISSVRRKIQELSLFEKRCTFTPRICVGGDKGTWLDIGAFIRSQFQSMDEGLNSAEFFCLNACVNPHATP
jgi:hypothetical protein